MWVEFYDIVEYRSADTVIFAGRERGERARNDSVLPLVIRTTRIFGYTGQAGWRQLYHHGSIDDPDLLPRLPLPSRGSAGASRGRPGLRD